MKLENMTITDLSAVLEYIEVELAKYKDKNDKDSLRMWQDWEWRRQSTEVVLRGRIHFIDFGNPMKAHYDEVFPWTPRQHH